MASWMVHLRIAENLLNRFDDLSPTDFIVGNIAPDSGVPNEDWSRFTPSGDVSHFKTTDKDGLKDIHLHEYVEQYFTDELIKIYNIRQYSFYLGYFTHLITDMMWADIIVRPSITKFRDLYDKSVADWASSIKRDWYDLDFLYIRENPDFNVFKIYKNAIGYKNEFINFFSEEAFDKRRIYITDFYSTKRINLDRAYTYLTKDEMDQFVITASEEIYQLIIQQYLLLSLR